MKKMTDKELARLQGRAMMFYLFPELGLGPDLHDREKVAAAVKQLKERKKS